jgi:hypothetical protein
MFIDVENAFCDADAVTASAASESVIDLMKARRGAGTPLKIFCQVQTTFASAAQDGTMSVKLQTDDDENFGSSTTHWTTPAIAEASLVAGYCYDLPDIPATSERYARLYFTVAGSGNFTAGKFDAGIVLDRQTNGYEHMAATD